MAKTKEPKVNHKNLAKETVYDVVKAALDAAGIENVDGMELDFTTKTIVARGIGENGNDVAITLTSPKGGEETYDYKVAKDEDEVVE